MSRPGGLTMNRVRFLSTVTLMLGALALAPLAARADSDVRDFEGLAYAPNNTVVAFGYFQHVSSQTGNLSEDVGVFRATYILKIGKLAIVPFDATLPIVDVQ